MYSVMDKNKNAFPQKFADVVKGGPGFLEPPLLFATRTGNYEKFKLHIEKCEDVNLTQKHKNYGTTALMYASRSGYIEMVKQLLEKGADINIKDDGGRTALDLAKENNHSEVVSLINTFSNSIIENEALSAIIENEQSSVKEIKILMIIDGLNQQ